MMDTVLNLGLNDATVEALAKNSGDKRFAYDLSPLHHDVFRRRVRPRSPSLRGDPRRPQRPGMATRCRDDAASFSAPTWRADLREDPFVSIDREGVGELVRIGVERGRKTKAKLKVGICGEHGGDPASVAFCHEIALDYVSCSPFRVPIARLAAAQAALGKGPAGEA